MAYCKIEKGVCTWTADQFLLWTLWKDYLDPKTGMKLVDLCGMFVGPKGKPINRTYITKHTNSTNYPTFDQKRSDGLTKLLWIDDKK